MASGKADGKKEIRVERKGEKVDKDDASKAAELLLREMKRGKDTSAEVAPLEPPKMEMVSLNAGMENMMAEEGEMEKQSRMVQERLEKRQAELKKQAFALERLREDLRLLEAPMKQEILKGREVIEELNRRESRCVASVNELRKSLHATEQELTEIRSEKTKSSEKLVLLMADYESKKREKLQKIEELIDGGTEKSKPSKQQVHFGGF